MFIQEVGQSIPSDTPHVTINFRLCAGNAKDVRPRFFVDKSITSFAATLIEHYGTPEEWATLFPSHAIAERCTCFFQDQLGSQNAGQVARVLNLLPRTDPEKRFVEDQRHIKPMISAVIYPKSYSSVAKSFWQHSGEGISSRRAELCHRAFDDGFLVPSIDSEQNTQNHEQSVPHRPLKGPRRYQRGTSVNGIDGDSESKYTPNHGLLIDKQQAVVEGAQFVEERYGRNLDLSLVGKAKLAIRRRIAGALTANVDLDQTAEDAIPSTSIRQVPGISEDDVYLYPSGMSSIFNTHRIMMACRGKMRSICFGFPYIDTLKILEKWGPGCQFYGSGSAEDLDDLERRCERGEKFLALFCEFPGNPLLKSPDLRRIRALADRFAFAVVVDETIGNFLNIHVLPHADVVVSSLTKVFSGDSNVMGGRSLE
ncbi:MAG: hypothetical protein Q9181_000369 [Wetmoreana brouardii]